jgi:hypothetical protein
VTISPTARLARRGDGVAVESFIMPLYYRKPFKKSRGFLRIFESPKTLFKITVYGFLSENVAPAFI